jgi:hypothetical protein
MGREGSDLIARGLLAVACADGLHESEALFLSSYLYLGEQGEEAEWLADLQSQDVPTPTELAEQLTTTEQRQLFARLAYGLASADGAHSAREQAILAPYLLELGVDNSESSFIAEAAEVAGSPLGAMLTTSARESAVGVYLNHLRLRDGIIDLEAGTLSKREVWFGQLESNPVLWPKAVDLVQFGRNSEKFVDRNADEIMLFLLVISKISRTENYGAVRLAASGRIEAAGEFSPDAYMNTEELYHTRILENIVRCFGIELEIVPPPVVHRALIHGMMKLPKSATLPIILASECAAAITFRLLIDKAEGLFSAHPDVRDRIVLLLQDILTDEIGHVAYCRSKLNGFGIRLTRSVYPVVVKQLLAGLPEMTALLGEGALDQGLANWRLDDYLKACSVPPFWIESSQGGEAPAPNPA